MPNCSRNEDVDARAVIPAKVGIQGSGCTFLRHWFFLDSRFRGNDGAGVAMVNGYLE